MNKEIAVPYQISITNSNGFLLTIAVKKLNASEIAMKELLPQKRCHKKNFNCIGTNEKIYCIGTSKNVLIFDMNAQLLIAEW